MKAHWLHHQLESVRDEFEDASIWNILQICCCRTSNVQTKSLTVKQSRRTSPIQRIAVREYWSAAVPDHPSVINVIIDHWSSAASLAILKMDCSCSSNEGASPSLVMIQSNSTPVSKPHSDSASSTPERYTHVNRQVTGDSALFGSGLGVNELHCNQPSGGLSYV